MVPWGFFLRPWGSLGGSQDVPGVLGPEPKGTENTGSSLCLGRALGGPWGDFGRLGWSLGPAQGVQMLICPLCFGNVFESEGF